MTGPTIALQRGSSASRLGTFRDVSGRSVAGYTGAESLSAEVWSGDDRSVLFAPSASWASPADAQFLLGFSASDTDLDPGLYPILVAVETDRKRVGFLEILASPGSTPGPLAYGTYDGVLRRAGEWLAKMQGTSNQSRFAEELHEAFDWTNRQVLSRCRAYLDRRAGGYLGDPEASGLLDATGAATGDDEAALIEARLAIVRGALDASGVALALTPGIVAANEHYAASIVLGRIMPAKDSADWAGMAASHRGRANGLLSAEAFGVDVDGDGAAEFTLGAV